MVLVLDNKAFLTRERRASGFLPYKENYDDTRNDSK